MTSGRRKWAFLAFTLVLLAAAGGYVVWAVSRGGDEQNDARASLAEIRQVTSAPFIVFLDSKSGRAPFDRLEIASIASPKHRLAIGLRCDRVSMSHGTGICIRHSVSTGLTYVARFFDRTFHVTRTTVAGGLPSRARVSPSGRVAVATTFTTGDSYLVAGQFSTATTIFSTRTGHELVKNLEQLHVVRDGRRFEPIDRNFWGVTFADDRRFYATMGTSSQGTFLVRGDLGTRTMTVIHQNAECPSLSPDGTRIAYKKRIASGSWHFTVLDLKSGRETPLAEQHSIDDQIAWLDDDHVLYGAFGAVWELRADGRGTPQQLLENADSPTVAGAGPS